MATQDQRREQLRAIRSEYGWREAAKVAKIPKRVRVAKPSNPSGFGYRTLSPKNIRDRLQRLIGGQVRADGSRDFTKVTKSQDKSIGDAIQGDTYKEARLRLAVNAINGYKAQVKQQVESVGGLSADERDSLEAETEPLSEAEIETMRSHLEADDWGSFRAEYDSHVSVLGMVA